MDCETRAVLKYTATGMPEKKTKKGDFKNMIRVSYLCDSVTYHYSLNHYYNVHVNLSSKANWL